MYYTKAYWPIVSSDFEIPPMAAKIEKQVPPRVLNFGIVNPAWAESPHAEDTSSLVNQVVCYVNLLPSDPNDGNVTQWSFPWSQTVANDGDVESHNSHISSTKNNSSESYTFDKRVSDNEIVKQVGLLQAIADIASKFNTDNAQISYIDTDKTRTIVGQLESPDTQPSTDPASQFWFFCQFQLTKVTLSTDEVRYIHRGLADPEYLQKLLLEGYELFVLNKGSLSFCEQQMSRQEVREVCTKWWSIWFKNRFEFDSSYGISDDGVFKLLPGIRCSSVNKPFGFNDNISKELKGFIETHDHLKDILVVNTNWTPAKNWGAVYADTETYSFCSITGLINMLKDIDQSFGLSTYALTYGNWPSLSQYIDQLKRMQSIKPNGGLLERSLMSPAIYLQQKLSNQVFNPLGDVVDTVESYVPIMSTIRGVSEYVTPSIATVSNVTLHPWNSMVSYWTNSSGTDGDSAVLESLPLHSEQVESRSASRRTNHSATVDESLETAEHSGSYLLGYTKQGSIVLHDYYLFNKLSGEWEMVKPLVYEINGILYVLLYDASFEDLKHSNNFYTQLSTELDAIYETYFTDLIVNQLCLLETELKKEPDFVYIVYDNKKYWTSIPNIPPDHDTLMHQIPQRISLLEQSLNLDLSTHSTSLDTLRFFSLIQDKQLQLIIKKNTTPCVDWKIGEKVTKLGKNQWCLFKRYNEHKWVIVVKRLACIERKQPNRCILGDDVEKWLDWVESDGYI